jgi:hypothetical protein
MWFRTIDAARSVTLAPSAALITVVVISSPTVWLYKRTYWTLSGAKSVPSASQMSQGVRRSTLVVM